MSLQSYIGKRVCVITVDGRNFVGVLLTCDQQTNIVLAETKERQIHSRDDEAPNEIHDVGTFVLRGDLVVLCGEVDEELDDQINWMEVKGERIRTTKHT